VDGIPYNYQEEANKLGSDVRPVVGPVNCLSKAIDKHNRQLVVIPIFDMALRCIAWDLCLM